MKAVPKSSYQGCSCYEFHFTGSDTNKEIPAAFEALENKKCTNFRQKMRSEAFSGGEKEEITNFYERNNISCLFPGRKDYKPIKNMNEKRIHLQKSLHGSIQINFGAI